MTTRSERARRLGTGRRGKLYRFHALEAMADLYRTLREEDAADWEAGSRASELKGERLAEGERDP